ncbi:unnamed protein product [Pseudo-nitzschia multistriata]|uniref:4'-phosphopantetheinyl transferase domain-containing protein n=1 Tax=Pseudo-nitzschia multistriata TaxID=183589 RepID=A0A448YUC1_9STRA|nr:unnamed protein product [Pseudo-nitzschia multistriata]
MTKAPAALGAILCVALRLGILATLGERAVGFPMAAFLPRACRHGFGGRQASFYRAGTVAARMASNTTDVGAGVVGGGEILASKRPGSLPADLATWFDVSLPEGRCIGVKTANETACFPQSPPGTELEPDHWIRSFFHSDEIEFGMTLKQTRNSFWLGRLAMRMALGYPGYPIVRDYYGRPRLREGAFGSISHKKGRGVALASHSVADPGLPGAIFSGVGVDLEMTSRPGRPSLAKRVLTASERESLGGIPGIAADEEVLLRFSLKEAIYKAAHPLLCQYVGFQEAEVTPLPDGTASCSWLLESGADDRIAGLTAHWRTIDDGAYFLTSASVFARPDFEGCPLADE